MILLDLLLIHQYIKSKLRFSDGVVFRHFSRACIPQHITQNNINKKKHTLIILNKVIYILHIDTSRFCAAPSANHYTYTWNLKDHQNVQQSISHSWVLSCRFETIVEIRRKEKQRITQREISQISIRKIAISPYKRYTDIHEQRQHMNYAFSRQFDDSFCLLKKIDISFRDSGGNKCIQTLGWEITS